MAVQLILKNSSVEDKRPTAAQLANGEISLNYSGAGAFLCCKDTDGNIQQVGGIKVDEDAPGSPVLGTLWLRASTSTLFIYDGNTWLAISGGSGGGTGGAIDQLVAGDGIDITPTSGVGVVTVDNDIDTNKGLEFVSGRTAVKIGKGLEFDGATGSINATATALSFKGTVDLTTPGDVPADPELGDSYVNVGDGVFDAEWAAATGEDPTTEASPGDLVVWNGTIWVYIPIGTAPSGADLDYAPTTGTSPGTGGTVLSTFGTDAIIPMAGHTQSGVLGNAAQAGLMKPEDRTLLDSLPVDGGEFDQVQSNWDEADITDPSYIQNKPDITVDGNDDITNVNVDLGYTAAADKGTVTNNRGTDAEIPFATAADAGLFIEPAAPTSGAVQYARQVTDAGVASWEEIVIDESSSVSVGETPPVDPEVGDLWWDSSDDSGRLYVWYVDGDSGQWVETSPAAPTPPEVETYWDKTGNILEPKEATDSVVIGGSNITLGADGSGTFGSTTASIFPFDSQGSNIDPNGRIELFKTTNSGLSSFLNGVSQGTTVAQILDNGSATFAGVMRVSADVNGSFAAIYENTTTDNANLMLLRAPNRASANALVALGVKDSTDTASTSYRASIRLDGSATFAGNVTSSGHFLHPTYAEGSVGTDNYGCKINKNGFVGIQKRASDPNSSDAFGITKGGVNTVKFTASGNAFFSGTVKEDQTITRSVEIQLEADNPANYTTDVDEEGNETETYIGPTIDVRESIETAVADRAAMRETFQELLVAVQAATDFGQLKAAMLVALEDYA